MDLVAKAAPSPSLYTHRLTDSQALMHLPAQSVRGLGLSQF